MASDPPSVQDKYSQIMKITLDKLDGPLSNSERVLERIADLLEVDLPQKKKPPVTAVQAQLIMTRLTQAENLANALLFLEGALQQLNYEPPAPLFAPSPVSNLPDPGITRTLRSRAELDALLDAISLSGVAAQQPPPIAAVSTPDPSPSPATSTTTPVHALQKNTKNNISYSDFQIEDHRKRDAAPRFTVTDTTRAKPPPDLSGYVARRPARTSTVTSTPAANPVMPAPAPTPVPAAANPVTPAPAVKPAPSGDPWANIETADLDELQKKMPKWTKGPPCTSDEIDEYKAFMVTKYEAEQKLNAEILRRKKLGIP